MEGKIKDISLDYKTRKTVLTLLVDCEPNVLEQFLEKRLDISIKEYRKKRSLDANAYFHVLVGKLAQVNGISFSHQKNDLITQYGQVDYITDEQPLYIKTNIPPETMCEQELLHMKFVKFSEDNAYWYRGYKGSHELNTAEMAKLIDGTVYECKEAGIETLTPNELERMKGLWHERRE